MANAYRQLLLKLPDPCTKRMREILSANENALEGVSVEPEDTANFPMRFRFTLDGVKYPALLVNLPCFVETLKTVDKAEYFKSGDVGQMLIVYANEADRPHDSSQGDGLTPPTQNVVQRKFVKARRPRGTYPKAQVKAVEEQLIAIRDFGGHDQCKEVYEEVVDFEPWMLDPASAEQGKMAGLSIEIKDEAVGKDGVPSQNPKGEQGLFGHDILLRHPEILLKLADVPPEHAPPVVSQPDAAESTPSVATSKKATSEHAHADELSSVVQLDDESLEQEIMTGLDFNFDLDSI